MTESTRAVLVAKYHVIPGSAHSVAEALAEMADEVRAHEPACLEFMASVDAENENLFCLYEVYVDEASLLAHRDTPHFQRIIQGRVLPLLERREREVYRLVVG